VSSLGPLYDQQEIQLTQSSNLYRQTFYQLSSTYLLLEMLQAHGDKYSTIRANAFNIFQYTFDTIFHLPNHIKMLHNLV